VTLAETVVGIPEPIVGHMVADMCVRTTAPALGKAAEELVPEDLPALEAGVRRLLSPVAPQETVTAIVARINGSV
jgi:hypothetical protein